MLCTRRSPKFILFSLSVLSLLSVGAQAAPLDLKKEAQRFFGGGETQALFSPIDARKDQLEKLKDRHAKLKADKKEVPQVFKRRAAELKAALAVLQEQGGRATVDEASFLAKESAIYTERKQHLVAWRDARNEAEEVLDAHAKTLEQIIVELTRRMEGEHEVQFFYSLRDLRGAQTKITTTMEQVRGERTKRDSLAKTKRSEEEDLSVVQKTTAEIQATLKDIINEPQAGTKTSDEIERDSELLRLRLTMLSERKEATEASIAKLDLDLAHRKDKLALLDLKLDRYRKRHALIQSRLNVSQGDVDAAKKEADEERKRVAEQINALSREQESKKAAKSREKNELDGIEGELKVLAEEKKEAEPDGALIVARKERIENTIAALDHEINLLGAQKDIEEATILGRELYVRLVEIAYKLQRNQFERRDVEQWLSELSKGKAKETSDAASLDEQISQINVLLNETKRKTDEIQAELEALKALQETTYRTKARLYADTHSAFSAALRAVERQTSAITETFQRYSDLLRLKRNMVREYDFLIKLVEQKRTFDIWRRSPNALSLRDATLSLMGAKEFFSEMVWHLPTVLNPLSWVSFFGQFTPAHFLGLLLLFGLFFLFFFISRIILSRITRRLAWYIAAVERGSVYLLLNLALSVTSVCLQHAKLFSFWAFVQLDIAINFKRFFGPFGGFVSYVESPYLVAAFYVVSVPLLLYLARQFIASFAALNKQLGFAFFNESFESRLVGLLKVVLYSAACLLPIRQAFIVLYVGVDSKLPAVVLALFTLILQVAAVTLLFFHKDELLKLIPSTNWFSRKAAAFFDQNAPLVFMFFLALLILSNPYVGYANFAYLLMYAVPLSVILIYALFAAHYYVRQYCSAWFLIEEDEEVSDRFEHAKTYYGIFIILSFLALSVLTFMAITEVWGIANSYDLLVYLLTERWTVVISADKAIGILDFARFTLYIAAGFLISTLVDKFVLNKIFDILRMEIGLRNTISTLLHYLIIYFVMIIGLKAIHLDWLITGLSVVVGGGIVLASVDLLKDLISGFLVFIERPIEIGSFIEAGEKKGTVIKITPRATTIRNLYHHSIVIPNRELMAHPISNWGFNRVSVGFDVELIVAYGEDPIAVRAVLKEVVEGDPRILRVPRVIYRLNDFTDNGMKFLIRAFISARRVREQWDISADLRMGIFLKLAEANIKLAYPHRILQFSGEEGSAKALKKMISVTFDDEKPE